MIRLSVINQISSIRFDSYKSFIKEQQYTVSLDKNLVLFIGRNNSGKSSIIDVIESVFSSTNTTEIPSGMENVCPSFVLDKKHIEDFFSNDLHSIDSSVGNDLCYGMLFLGKNFTVHIDDHGGLTASKQQIERYAKALRNQDRL